MSKKRIAVMVAGVAMFATLAVGSTMAWFTDTENATNKFTMGFVDVVLDEESSETAKLTDSEDGIDLQFADVMPGDTLDKDVDISLNSGSADAYVRVKVDFDYADGLDVSENPTLTLGEAAITASNWTYDEDGYYYYTGEGTTPIALTADDGVVNFFDTVNIPEEWGNAMTNQDFNLVITVDAIQSENFTATDDWDIDDYEAPAID